MMCGVHARFFGCMLVATYFLAVSGEPQGPSAQAQTQAQKRSDPGKPSAQSPWLRREGEAHALGVIVFVHGVLGDPFNTWSNGRSYWPEMLTKDKAFDGWDIYVYRYRSSQLRKSLSIDEVAQNLHLDLRIDGVLRYKTIAFVSHSMGGLVTRTFLVKYQSEVVSKVRFLYFFATPTTGSPYAKLAELFSKNPQFGQMLPMNNPDSYLAPLQGYWLAGHFGLKSYCAYETQPVPVLGSILVEKDSATHLCTEDPVPVDADHFNIVKPLDEKSTAYRALQLAVEETSIRPVPIRPKNSPNHTSGRVPEVDSKTTSEKSTASANYCFLLATVINHLSATSPAQLTVVNPGKLPVMAKSAIMRSGTGSLWAAIPTPNPGTSYRLLEVPIPIELGMVAPGTSPLPFEIGPGNYIFEIGTAPSSLTENMQLFHQNGQWVQVIEVYRNGELIYSTPRPVDQPDIGLTISNPKSPAISLDNLSGLLIRDPYCKVVLWRLSERDAEPLVWTHVGSWIRPREHYGRIPLMDQAHSPFMKNGEELFGYVIVTCPECADTKAYSVGLKIGEAGWYSEFEPGQFPWSTATFVKSMKWPVNEIPLRPGENRKHLFEVPLY